MIVFQMVRLPNKVHHPAMTTTNIVLLGLIMENAQEVLTTLMFTVQNLVKFALVVAMEKMRFPR